MSNEKCYNCDGTGVCPTCNGTGTNKGMNLHPSRYLIDEDDVKCLSCMGKGYCTVCNGTGRI